MRTRSSITSRASSLTDISELLRPCVNDLGPIDHVERPAQQISGERRTQVRRQLVTHPRLQRIRRPSTRTDELTRRLVQPLIVRQPQIHVPRRIVPPTVIALLTHHTPPVPRWPDPPKRVSPESHRLIRSLKRT